MAAAAGNEEQQAAGAHAATMGDEDHALEKALLPPLGWSPFWWCEADGTPVGKTREEPTPRGRYPYCRGEHVRSFRRTGRVRLTRALIDQEHRACRGRPRSGVAHRGSPSPARPRGRQHRHRGVGRDLGAPRLGPGPSDQIPVPTKQRRRRDEEGRPALTAEQSCKRCQHGPISREHRGRATWRRSTPR